MKKVYLIIPPGLEDLALKEIQMKLPVGSFELSKGGIEVEVDLDWIMRAHLLLKIPTRLLLRLTEFKVRDFPKLYQKMQNFKWNEFLSHPEPQFEISAAKSRLNHTGRLEETIRKALTEAQKKQPLSLDWKKKNFPPQTFYVRLQDDLLTLSLDLTGEPLYKRGVQVIKGEAPLRENFAAAFILELFEGISTPMTLVDPMCGSATFLTEATGFFQPLHQRPFAFETAPFFKGHLLPKILIEKKLPLKVVRGFDINAGLIKKIEMPGIKLDVLDSLKEKLPIEEDKIIICNPPYGERIKVQGKRGSFLQEAWEKFIKVDCPLRFGWLLPRDMDDLFPTPPGYTLRNKRHLKNGGLPVTFWLWERVKPL
jgi:putative N6-adenine-specific DNA methylase